MLALIRKGKFRVNAKFSCFEISDQSYASLSEKDRVKQFNKFCTYKMEKPVQPLQVSLLATNYLTFIPHVPPSILREIEANVYNNRAVQGFGDYFYVRDGSRKKNTDLKVSYNCNTFSIACEKENCARFRIFGVCSHTLTVARSCGIVSRKRKPTLTDVANFGKDTRAGKKPKKKKR